MEQQYAQVLQREQEKKEESKRKQEESKRSGFDVEAFIKGEKQPEKNPFLEDLQERFLKDLEQSATPTPAKTRIPSPNQR